MIDSHCHLADTAFDDDLPAVLARAREVGVERIVTIADNLPEAEKCIGLAREFPQLFATVGVHPHNAKEWKRGDADRLRTMVASSQKVRAIGEIGLDYHYDLSPRDVQRDVFREQLSLAKEMPLPAVIHCREAIADVKAIIGDVGAEKFVLHCCTEAWNDVSALVERGAFLSFTGMVTYPKADVIRSTVEQCPIEKLMIETDAPYLAPVPYRGKRNEPAFVAEVLRKVAEIKRMDIVEVDRITTENALRFFGIALVG
ncbi:MAG: TatD family hydrolase [Candidatus Peregrinibacteria bacterium]|nr:TatD family hydrolase [Candidatus Peregrinibacteria bacterium]